MDIAKEYVVSEMEWWDQVAMAVDLLAKKPGTIHRKLMVKGRIVDWLGDESSLPAEPSADATAVAEVSACLYNGLRDVEILRRLNHMPDETPLDLLMLPFAIYCPENKSLVAINIPDMTLREHLIKLEQQRSAS